MREEKISLGERDLGPGPLNAPSQAARQGASRPPARENV
jgi:hypothetical protein